MHTHVGLGGVGAIRVRTSSHHMLPTPKNRSRLTIINLDRPSRCRDETSKNQLHDMMKPEFEAYVPAMHMLINKNKPN